MVLNKNGFVELFSKKGYTKKNAAMIYEDFILTLMEALVAGDSVVFHGFGTFSVVERKGIEGSVDFQTKEIINIPPYRGLKFTAGKFIKKAIKEGFIRE